jgi:four helix bundle protein
MPPLDLDPAFMCMAPHKRFLAWQECHKLVLAVYKATESFPKHELYGLTSQLRRAVFSAAANIVEGASRQGRNEFRHFLDISLGSLAEVEYGLEVALALKYLKVDTHLALESQQRRAQFLTWKLKMSLT